MDLPELVAAGPKFESGKKLAIVKKENLSWLTQEEAAEIIRRVEAHDGRVKALESAERAIILLHCNKENTRAPHDGRVPGCEICANFEIIQQALSGEPK